MCLVVQFSLKPNFKRTKGFSVNLLQRSLCEHLLFHADFSQ